MLITKEDVGRKVRIGDGRVGFITKDRDDEFPYAICNVDDPLYVYCHVDHQGVTLDKSLGYSVVEFLDEQKEEKPQFIITEKDVGRKVIDGHGQIEEVLRFQSHEEHQVTTERSIYTAAGKWYIDRDYDRRNDLVGFVDEVMEKEVDVYEQDVLCLCDDLNNFRKQLEAAVAAGFTLQGGHRVTVDYEGNFYFSQILVRSR